MYLALRSSLIALLLMSSIRLYQPHCCGKSV